MPASCNTKYRNVASLLLEQSSRHCLEQDDRRVKRRVLIWRGPLELSCYKRLDFSGFSDSLLTYTCTMVVPASGKETDSFRHSSVIVRHA